LTKAKGPNYLVHFRRRRAGRTDYQRRLALLKSGIPRMVVRKTNRYIVVQVSSFQAKGDTTIAHATSQALKGYGFAGKCNAPSAYLTGLLVGRMAKARGVTKVILDIGLHAPTQGSIIFCAQKGAIDAGVESPLNVEKLPDESRINGSHLKADADFAKAKDAIMKADMTAKPAKATKKVEQK
jgi:large subunit ribosomal protein L18